MKIVASSHGHQAIRVAAAILKLGLPEELEDVFKLAKDCDFGAKGMLGVIDATGMLLRLDPASGYERFSDEQLDSTLFEKYRTTFVSPAHHPWAKDDFVVVVQQL